MSAVAGVISMGFSKDKAEQAVAALGPGATAEAAVAWLLDNGEEDKGGSVQFKVCQHVDELRFQRLQPAEDLKLEKTCKHGCDSHENWLCLHCGEARCGRYGNKHSIKHWEETRRTEESGITVADAAAGIKARGHCLAMGLNDLSIWCYECQSYVEHEQLQPLYQRMQELKFGTDYNVPATPNAESQPVVEGSSIDYNSILAHGRLGDRSWALPTVARACATLARPGYRSMMAHEYLDADEVLRCKVDLVVRLLRSSQHCVAYTGAGISTASGISDWATRASDSVASAAKNSPWLAQPTFAHRTLAAMYHAGHLRHWVQQNHDGLPQKAGFPQEHINEIHGAIYDPSNPVVPMSGTLRLDLIQKMVEWESKADLCLCLGTSLVGMNADRVALDVSERQKRGVAGALGTIIVTLQKTQHDGAAAVRLFCTIDRFAELVADALGLNPQPLSLPSVPLAFHAPYGADGCREPGARLSLDFQPGQQFLLLGQPDWDKARHGRRCTVVQSAKELQSEGHVTVKMEKTGELRVLGRWWLEAAAAGAIEKLPLVPA